MFGRLDGPRKGGHLLARFGRSAPLLGMPSLFSITSTGLRSISSTGPLRNLQELRSQLQARRQREKGHPKGSTTNDSTAESLRNPSTSGRASTGSLASSSSPSSHSVKLTGTVYALEKRDGTRLSLTSVDGLRKSRPFSDVRVGDICLDVVWMTNEKILDGIDMDRRPDAGAMTHRSTLEMVTRDEFHTVDSDILTRTLGGKNRAAYQYTGRLVVLVAIAPPSLDAAAGVNGTVVWAEVDSWSAAVYIRKKNLHFSSDEQRLRLHQALADLVRHHRGFSLQERPLLNEEEDIGFGQGGAYLPTSGTVFFEFPTVKHVGKVMFPAGKGGHTHTKFTSRDNKK